MILYTNKKDIKRNKKCYEVIFFKKKKYPKITTFKYLHVSRHSDKKVEKIKIYMFYNLT